MEDFDELYALEQACFGGSWTREMLLNELNDPHTLLLCERIDGEIAAFAIGRVVVDEGELFQIGTHPNHRKKGIATRVLQRLDEKMRKNGAVVCFLEVRSCNCAAIALYEKAGYKRMSVRKNYYPDDDAVVMRKEL